MKRSSLKRFIIISLCTLVGASINAQGAFRTNLLKTEVHKTSLGTVKVTIYTNKPYSDILAVNKKSDFEYVILLPETANSTTAKPSLGGVSDVVKNVEIKTQQYQNNIKGYTKIVIHTNKKAEITPQVKVLTPIETKLSDKDYKELLAQTTSKQSAKSKVQKVAPTIKQNDVKKHIEQKVYTQTTAKIATKKPKATLTVKKQQPKITPKPQRAKQTKVEAQPKIIEQVENKSSIPAELEKQTKVTSHPDVITPQEPKKISEPVQQTLPSRKIRKIQKIKNIIKKGVIIIESNMYTVLGFLAAMFILLIFAAKKITKNHAKQKEIFKTHLDEKPIQPTNIEGQISEDMDWKEKFQTYVDSTKETETPQPQNSDSEIEELDELFGSEYEELTDENNVSFEEQPYSTGFEEIQDYPTEEDEASVDDLFAEPDEEPENEEIKDFSEYSGEEIEEISDTNNIEEEEELVKSEFAIDEEKGFYLVDFEDKTTLVGHIKEEIFVLKTFDEQVDATIQARLSEKKSKSENYMTRVGGFKGMVEVTPDSMKLLIEL